MRLTQHIPNIKFPTYGWRKKHKASCKKYKPCILKYKALISKYVTYIFHLSKLLKHSFPRKQKSATFPLRFSFVFFVLLLAFCRQDVAHYAITRFCFFDFREFCHGNLLCLAFKFLGNRFLCLGKRYIFAGVRICKLKQGNSRGFFVAERPPRFNFLYLHFGSTAAHNIKFLGCGV